MENSSVKTGRPRAFDESEALEAALQVFWKRGYEGASLTELTEAMGINRPSLYATFGNKEELFRKALDRYAEKTDFLTQALSEPKIAQVIEKLLIGFADAQTDPNNPPGCLATNSALACSEESQAIQHELCARRLASQLSIQSRLERAKEEGELPKGSDPADMARYIAIISQGMSVQAAGGTTREDLRRVAILAAKSLLPA